jgi:ketosteroid isomerase-like protein
METVKEIQVNNRNVPGLMDLIREAMTENEVRKLVANGKENYHYASSGTVRKWDKLAKKRIEELNVKDDVVSDPPVVKKEKKKTVKK